eukprot:GGOE01034377.1.p1 GENE.GGOE01034377.1~~GGOE01034377.1.p1  ORF type:complete len:136 (-),score=8.89 GGOE01034377.1:44-451(-)
MIPAPPGLIVPAFRCCRGSCCSLPPGLNGNPGNSAAFALSSHSALNCSPLMHWFVEGRTEGHVPLRWLLLQWLQFPCTHGTSSDHCLKPTLLAVSAVCSSSLVSSNPKVALLDSESAWSCGTMPGWGGRRTETMA